MNPLFYELPLVFVSGVLGSAHCIGMCGAISAAMNVGTSTVRGSVLRQLLWSTGRTFTYAFLGMLAGFAGAQLTQSQYLSAQTSVVTLQTGFAIVAGLLLTIQGLLATGWLRAAMSYLKSLRSSKADSADPTFALRNAAIRRRMESHPCLSATLFGSFLRGGSNTGVFIAGVLTGFLPCGLVYSFLALAAATSSVWKAPLLMTAFGMGTVPVMLLTGIGLNLASLRLRQRLLKAAAVCVVLTGLLTIGRGIAFAARAENQKPEQACPLCQQHAVSPKQTQ